MLSDQNIADITRFYGDFQKGEHAKVFANEDFGYRRIVVERPQMLATGTPIFYLRGVMHAGFKVVGDKVLKFYTVHVVDKGKPLFDGVK